MSDDLGDADDLYADFGSPVGEGGGSESVSALPKPSKQALQEQQCTLRQLPMR